MRIMIACRAIDNMAGGIERQALALANEMAQRGHKVCLFTWDHDKAAAFYRIDEAVTWYKLDMGTPAKKAGFLLRFKRMKRIRKVVRKFKPEVCLGFQEGVFIAMRAYTLGMGIHVIAAERETLERHKYVKRRMPIWLTLFLFRFAKRITVQCPSYVSLYPKSLRKKIAVIPNAIQPATNFAYPKTQEAQTKVILCVGRLTFQKNHEALLRSFSLFHNQYPDWRIECVGGGGLEASLQLLSKELGLSDKVTFHPPSKKIQAYYVKAHFLVIPSKWEGFPNVLGEAMAHGLPAVGYHGCGGIPDLIEDGVNGFLAQGNGDVMSLKNALIKMINSESQYEEMSLNNRSKMKQYERGIVYNQWEDLIKGLYK